MVGLERAGRSTFVIDAGVFRMSLRMLWSGEVVHRRRRSKNSGGGIAPAAIGVLIEGTSRSVNAFRRPQEAGSPPENADKVLMRLNFTRCPVNG
jgi:hypothetical protein